VGAREACEHYRESCRYLADFNTLAYRKAQQKLIDALLRLPLEEMRQLIDRLVEAWRAAGLEEHHPSFIEAWEQIRHLRIL
jgi:hypothetical protein